jgi:hypothetical protein
MDFASQEQSAHKDLIVQYPSALRKIAVPWKSKLKVCYLSAKFEIHNSSGRCASRKTQFPLRHQSGTGTSRSRIRRWFLDFLKQQNTA